MRLRLEIMFCTKIYTIIWILLFTYTTYASVSSSTTKDFIDSCKKDLTFIRTTLKNDSATYANKNDKEFHSWYNKGYKETLELIEHIGDKDDCYYAIKYYINGFKYSHIAIRGYIPLPAEQYPGILSVRKPKIGTDDIYNHYIIYKNPVLKYLNNVHIGDRITHINDIDIDTYYKDYLLPFYANERSDFILKSAAMHALIIDGNRYKPVPQTITLKGKNAPITVDLKYTELHGHALEFVRNIKQSHHSKTFAVEMVSNGVWVQIPSFFPNEQEEVYYTGMLATIKNHLATEDYILFDMRGNRGGASKWSRTIIRNLWGDDTIRKLGSAHDYNQKWSKYLRVSKNNFIDFTKTYSQKSIKQYALLLKQGKEFLAKEWSVYRDTDNLYTNTDNTPFNAKIYVLTDAFCRSTCWTFVKELTQMPNVMHIGQPTSIHTIYSFAKHTRSPSKHFDLFYPTQIRITPHYQVNNILVPHKIYHGDINDESQLIDWVLSITESD